MSLILSGLRNTTGRFVQLGRNGIRSPFVAVQRLQFSDQNQTTPTTTTNTEETLVDASASKLSGFAQAFERHSLPLPEAPAEPAKSFATLFRNSKFVDLGDHENKIVTGKIFHIVDDDLYIDFGWKFHCVCTRPTKNGNEYVRGAKVRLRIRDLELSTRFLGSEKDLTILEADCQITGLVMTPARSSHRASSAKQ